MEMSKDAAKTLTRDILIAMAVGLVVGVILNAFKDQPFVTEYLTGGLFFLGGKIFVASLKLLVVPLVLVSLICGTAALDDITKLGRVGGKTMLFYLITTATAISLAMLVAFIIQPGVGFNLTSEASFVGKEAPSILQTIINIFPTNPFAAMADGKMLQIIVFAILSGIAMSLSGEPGKRVIGIFQDLNAVIMKMVIMIMLVAPYGVFCLIAKVFAEQGFGAILPLAKYFFVVLGVLLLHVCITYFSFLKFVARVNPIQFFKKFRSVLVFAFSTSSSNATIPVTMEAVEKKIGVKKSIASFTVPLGATINMDGTAIMQGVATVFISQAYGVPIGLSGVLAVVVTATLASIGTAGVPGVGLITLAMVLKQVDLPVEGIGLIIGVDRILDMVRTAVNVTGDAAISVAVAKGEGEFDESILNAEA